MVNFIADPDLAELVPPFVAHLPTSFSSPKPPPTLIPLLAPITRARLSHLSFQNPAPWPSLLSWSSSSANEIQDHLTEQDFYFLQHPPVAGQQSPYTYRGARRLDVETLQCAVEVSDLGLLLVYLFITNDENGEDDGWKVLDLRILDDDSQEWQCNVEQAEEAYGRGGDAERKLRLRSLSSALSIGGGGLDVSSASPTADDDDDDYWGRYDDEDSEGSSRPQTSDEKECGPADEDAYYARYNDVQPAMDPDVPTPMPTSPPRTMTTTKTPPQRTMTSTPPQRTTIPSPVPLSTHSPVRNLEQRAQVNEQSEIAIKQHVSTSMKSMYRLWRSAGLEKDDFERMVKTELDVLQMMDEDGPLGT